MAHLPLIRLDVLLEKTVCVLGLMPRLQLAMTVLCQSSPSPVKAPRKRGRMDQPCPAFPRVFWVEQGVGAGGCVTHVFYQVHLCMLSGYLSGCSAGGQLFAELGDLLTSSLFHPSSWSSARPSCMEGLF